MGSSGKRCTNFYQIRFNSNPDTLGNAAISAIGRGDDQTNLIRAAFWLDQFGSLTCPTPQSMSDASIVAVATAFRDAVLHNCSF